MNFIAHILAVYAALRLIGRDANVSPEAAIERASWHLALANNSVAWGWGNGFGEDAANERRRLLLVAARRRLIGEAIGREAFEFYWNIQLLNSHWRLPATAPSVSGLPDYNIHWGWLDRDGNVNRQQGFEAFRV